MLENQKLNLKQIIDLAFKVTLVESTKDVVPLPQLTATQKVHVGTMSANDRKNFVEKRRGNTREFLREEIEFLRNVKLPDYYAEKIFEYLQDPTKEILDSRGLETPKEHFNLRFLAILYFLANEVETAQGIYKIHTKLNRIVPENKSVYEFIKRQVNPNLAQPLHDLFYKLEPVKNKDNRFVDQLGWYTFFNRYECGAALKYIAVMRKLERGGKAPASIEEANAILLKCSYGGTAEIESFKDSPDGVTKESLLEYTDFCATNLVPESVYHKGLSMLIAKPTYTRNGTLVLSKIPNIEIDGIEVGLLGYKLRVLAKRDWRTLLMGYFTNCCQSIENDGGDCAEQAFTNQNAGIVVIERGNKIVAQSFVWNGEERNGKKTFVFDSWERLGAGQNFLCVPFYTKMAKILKTQHGYGTVAIGMGGNGKDVVTQIYKKLGNPISYIQRSSPSPDSREQVEICGNEVMSGVIAKKGGVKRQNNWQWQIEIAEYRIVIGRDTDKIKAMQEMGRKIAPLYDNKSFEVRLQRCLKVLKALSDHNPAKIRLTEKLNKSPLTIEALSILINPIIEESVAKYGVGYAGGSIFKLFLSQLCEGITFENSEENPLNVYERLDKKEGNNPYWYDSEILPFFEDLTRDNDPFWMHEVGNKQWNLLHYAINARKDELVSMILSVTINKQALIMAKSCHGLHSITWAMYQGSYKILDELLSTEGIDKEEIFSPDFTLLRNPKIMDHAVSVNDLQAIEILNKHKPTERRDNNIYQVLSTLSIQPPKSYISSAYVCTWQAFEFISNICMGRELRCYLEENNAQGRSL